MRAKLRPNAFLTFGLETYCFRHSSVGSSSSFGDNILPIGLMVMFSARAERMRARVDSFISEPPFSMRQIATLLTYSHG